jgi:hypothetical protein
LRKKKKTTKLEDKGTTNIAENKPGFDATLAKTTATPIPSPKLLGIKLLSAEQQRSQHRIHKKKPANNEPNNFISRHVR